MPCINPCKICNTNKFVTQMDFYLATFSHVFAVNAKSCLNSNETHEEKGGDISNRICYNKGDM